VAHRATRWLGLAGLLLAVLLASGCASVAAWLPTPAGAEPPPAPTRPARPEFQLVVEAPTALRELLLRHLDLARLQQLPDDERLGNAEFNRLVAAVPAQARALLQTEGYFDAQVSVQREDERLPEGRRTAVPGVVRVLVQPGNPIRVTALQLQAEGALQQQLAAGDAEALALQRSLPASGEGSGVLGPGQVFRNADWSATKQQLVNRLRSAGYAAASLLRSEATVDPDAQTALLSVTLDSGPRFLAGPVLVSGLQQHDAAMVQALAGFGPGAPLTEARLTAYQDRLQKTKLFNSVSVTIEPDPASAAAAPVRVRLGEALLQQATVGAGISANTGPRVTLEHTHRRFFGQPVVADNKLEWGRDLQSWSGDFSTHPGAGFRRRLLGVQVERVKSNTDVVLSQRLRLGVAQDTPRIERLFFAELLRSHQADLPGSAGAARSGGVPAVASALSGNAHWVWRDLDSVLLPTRGLSLALQTGAGQATQRNGPSGPFVRVYGRLTGYLPLGQRWYGSARIELGQVQHGQGVHVPDALGFRAGGDDSVRGYAYRALAPTDAGGGTISGERLLTASVELARPILPSMPSLWGALFIDAGRAVSSWRDYTPAWGYGAGLRWRSPIGPLRIDLAWADELKKLRLHFSVGIAF
jgi:translocation and assembly module TamA